MATWASKGLVLLVLSEGPCWSRRKLRVNHHEASVTCPGLPLDPALAFFLPGGLGRVTVHHCEIKFINRLEPSLPQAAAL
ncbi:hypothetical protein B0H14DRAFT_2955178 [Mycena olivaceomarginata]|nr:hypothetical protein B0H14DRAFT_2955178 [Mycena olivaceomarginata]